MTVFRLPRMSKNEIKDLISEQFLCRIAFVGERYPHIAPFQYVLLNGALYFHFTDYGRKMKLLKSGKRVCVEIEKYESDMSEFKFVTLKGRLKIVTDPMEREDAINKMTEHGRRMLSKNFLAAHGLKKEDDWSSFNFEKPLIIVKLNSEEESGLKSP